MIASLMGKKNPVWKRNESAKRSRTSCSNLNRWEAKSMTSISLERLTKPSLKPWVNHSDSEALSTNGENMEQWWTFPGPKRHLDDHQNFRENIVWTDKTKGNFFGRCASCSGVNVWWSEAALPLPDLPDLSIYLMEPWIHLWMTQKNNKKTEWRF